MKDREETIAFEMNYCQHYHPKPGLVKNSCDKGVDIDKVRVENDSNPKNPSLFMRPCIAGHTLSNPTAACGHWIRRTREMGEARADKVQKSMEVIEKVMPVVAEWRTWTRDNRVSKQEVIECPTGCGGKLHLSQSSYNGHVRGQCTTPGCASWIE